MQAIQKFLFVVCMAVMIGCAGLTFSQQSLQDDQQITRDAVELIKNANENYSKHAAAAETLRAYVTQVYQREQTRKGNNATVAMWNEVMTAKGNLFDLLDQWKTRGTLSPATTKEASRQIERLLNSIYDLENHKKR